MIVKRAMAGTPSTDMIINGMAMLHDAVGWNAKYFIVFKFEKEATKYMYPICNILYPNCSVEVGDDHAWSAEVYIDDKCEAIITGSTE